MILSIFAGRIADTGVDPIPTIYKSVKLSEKFKNIQILWASTREVLNINQANEVGCHIITVTTDLIKKLNLKNKDLNSYSLETVKMFFEDAQKSRYTI